MLRYLTFRYCKYKEGSACDHPEQVPEEELRSLNKGTRFKPKSVEEGIEQKKRADERDRIRRQINLDSKKKPAPAPASPEHTTPAPFVSPQKAKAPQKFAPRKQPTPAGAKLPDTPRKVAPTATESIRAQLESLEKGKRSTRSLTKAKRNVCDDSPYASRLVGFLSNAIQRKGDQYC